VDLVLTDPPYGIGEARKVYKRATDGVKRPGGPPRLFIASDWDNKPPDPEVIDQMRELSCWQIVFGGNYFALPPTSCWLVWDKDNGETDFADCELAWTNLEKAVRKFKWRWNGMLQEDMAKKEFRQHPTQKPLPLMKWCIQQADNVKTILDPFMGSGTTLVAARSLGLRAIGIELEEKYCAIAVERFRQQAFSFEVPASYDMADKGISDYQESLLLEA
jgi:DNA modification methylase